jgi:hypothetical protein
MFLRGGPCDPHSFGSDHEPGCAPCADGLFCTPCPKEDHAMANHLTPDELAKEMGIDREEVIRICIAEGVPIYHGKIDKTLFQASHEAVGAAGATSRP